MIGLEEEIYPNGIEKDGELIKWTRDWLDGAIYEHQTSVKPDIRCHPCTKIYPQFSKNEQTIFTCIKADDKLVHDILDFWRWVFYNIPEDDLLKDLGIYTY